MATPKFGLIAEGITDIPVLENILVGFFKDKNASGYIKPLQPLRDKTNQKQVNQAGWSVVFEYCQSEEFQDAFLNNAFIIIQIDTDCAHQWEYKGLDLSILTTSYATTECLLLLVRSRFELLIINAFGEEWYEQYKHRIIYAIAVDEIECWLLPAIFQKNLKNIHIGAIHNCLHLLNGELVRNNKRPINSSNKGVSCNIYDDISSAYWNYNRLLQLSIYNPSLDFFVQYLQELFPN